MVQFCCGGLVFAGLLLEAAVSPGGRLVLSGSDEEHVWGEDIWKMLEPWLVFFSWSTGIVWLHLIVLGLDTQTEDKKLKHGEFQFQKERPIPLLIIIWSSQKFHSDMINCTYKKDMILHFSLIGQRSLLSLRHFNCTHEVCLDKVRICCLMLGDQCFPSKQWPHWSPWMYLKRNRTVVSLYVMTLSGRIKADKANSGFHIGERQSNFWCRGQTFYTEPNGGIFDASPKNARASPMWKHSNPQYHNEFFSYSFLEWSCYVVGVSLQLFSCNIGRENGNWEFELSYWRRGVKNLTQDPGQERTGWFLWCSPLGIY